MPSAKRFIASSCVIITALCALFLPVIFTEHSVLQFTNGILSYPVDDTYIHMSIAKNIAQNQTWGINAGQFASASSSILYSLILAVLFKLFSVNVTIPLIVNIVTAVVLIIVVQQRLLKERVSFKAQVVILLIIIFFVPLPALVISGMEHTLQCLFSFIFYSVLKIGLHVQPSNKIKTYQ